jgi:uncharacterized membrane protein YcaP (DUF421 family)
MRRNRYTLDELMEHLRKNEITDIATVRFAILETDGTLSTVKYAADAPATPAQLNLAVEEVGIPSVLISDGTVIEANLKKLGFDARWLEKRLREAGYREPREVFCMTADDRGRAFFSPMTD